MNKKEAKKTLIPTLGQRPAPQTREAEQMFFWFFFFQKKNCLLSNTKEQAMDESVIRKINLAGAWCGAGYILFYWLAAGRA